jgi:hypothetical protein
MKRPRDGSSPSEARTSEGDDATAALLIAQLEVRRHEDTLAAASRAVDAEAACTLAAAGMPSTAPPRRHGPPGPGLTAAFQRRDLGERGLVRRIPLYWLNCPAV